MELHLRAGRRRVVALTAVLLAIELFDEVIDGLSQAAWPLVRADLDLSYTQIGLLFAVPTLFAHVVEPLFGLLGDVWRRQAVIALGGLGYATALVAFAAAGEFAAMLVAMMVLYPSSGAFVALSQATLVDMNADDAERAMVGWTVAGSLGVAVGPLLLTAIIAFDAGWRDAYVGLGFLALALALTFAVVSPPGQGASDDGSPSFREALRDAFEAFRNVRVVRWLLLLAAVDLILETFVGFLALYLVDEASATMTEVAACLTAWTVAALAGEALLLLVIQRIDGLRLVQTTSVIVGALIVAFLVVPGIGPKAVLLGMIAFTSAGWYSVLVARFYAELEGKSGVAMAVGSIVGPIKAMVPAAIGLLAESAGLQTAMWSLLLGPLILVLGIKRLRLSEAG